MSTNLPFFSVVIPLYNKENDIQGTLQSLLKQSFKDFEVVLIDDGSTDGSVQKVKDIEDPRIKLISKDNEGVAKTRNFGVEKASASYVAFLDADDFWHENHLENLYDLILLFPNHFWYATAYEKQYNPSLIRPMNSPIIHKEKHWKGAIDNYFKWSLKDPLAWTSAVCMKKEFFQKLSGFDATITMGAGEDTDLWLRAALDSPLAFSNKITARHNLDSSNRLSKISALQRRYMDLDQYENHIDSHEDLKRYLDGNRYGIAMHHRLAGDHETYKELKTKIDVNSLSSKQRFLLNQSKTGLKFLKWIQGILYRLNVRPSSF